MRMDLDNISDELEGQGHRSKVKVATSKNMILGVSDKVNQCSFTVITYDAI